MYPYEFTPILLDKYKDLETASEIIRTCRKRAACVQHNINHAIMCIKTDPRLNLCRYTVGRMR